MNPKKGHRRYAVLVRRVDFTWFSPKRVYASKRAARKSMKRQQRRNGNWGYSVHIRECR